MIKIEYKGDYMYENPKFDVNNEKILCEMGGKNADILSRWLAVAFLAFFVPCVNGQASAAPGKHAQKKR